MKKISRRSFIKRTGIAASGLAIPFLHTNPFILQAKGGFEPPDATLAPSAYQLQTPDQAVLMDVSSAVYDARFTQLVNQGYRPIWLQGVDNGNSAATYSAIYVRDGFSPWYEYRGMTAATFQTNFTNLFNQGYRPVSVSGYQDVGANRFCAIWVYDPGRGYIGIINANSAQYQTFVNTAVADHLWPTVVDGYAVGSNPAASDDYISVWADLPATAAQARHRLTSAEYQTFFNTYAPQGFHVTSVSAYKINSTNYFAAIMTKDSVTDWGANHDASPASLYAAAVANEKNDYQPIVIESYDNGAARKFAGVWIKRARKWTLTGGANAHLASFDNAMQTFMQARNIPGGTLAVTRNSRLVFARGYRWDGYNHVPVNPLSLFRIASLTKQLTSMAVMRLVQEGHLKLTDKLTTLLSAVLPAPLDSRMNNITVLHLLQHMGGWNRDTSGFDPMFADQTVAATQGVALPVTRQDIMNYMTSHRLLDFTPGTLQDYSNYGYLLLGRIIEAISHVSYPSYVQLKVLEPLGITRIVQGKSELENRKTDEVPYFTTDPSLYPNMRHAGAPVNVMASYGNFNLENMDSHGGYLATAVDMVRFCTALDATGGHPVLNQASIDKTFAVTSLGPSPDGSWYACGWSVRPAGNGINTWHNGSLTGTSTLMVRRFDGLNWVVLFNQRDDPSGLNYGDIDGALHVAADAVTQWPVGDLFPSYGLASLYPYATYLPDMKK